MVAHDAIGDEDVPEAYARQFAEITVVLGIKAGLDDIDQAYRALLAGTGLEELLLARPDGAALELAFDQRESLLDFFLIRAGAVAPE